MNRIGIIIIVFIWNMIRSNKKDILVDDLSLKKLVRDIYEPTELSHQFVDFKWCLV